MVSPPRPGALHPVFSLAALVSSALLAAGAGSCTPGATAAGSEVAVVMVASAPAPTEEPAPPEPRTPWKVGAVFNLLSSEMALGLATRQGIELAVDEVNAGGGPRGRKLLVLFEDDHGSSDEAARAVQKLIGQDGVVAVIGEIFSSRAKAGGTVANKLGVPLITTAATSPDVTQVGPFVFRAGFNDFAQAIAAARFLVRDTGKKRLGLLVAGDDVYSTRLAAAFKAEAARLGGKIVAEQSFNRTETDLSTQLKELHRRSPDAIYTPIYAHSMQLVAQQAQAAGLRGDMFLGGDGWPAEELLQEDALEGAGYTDHWAMDAPWPASRAFAEHFRARFRRDPSSLSALGYDAARLVASAIDRAHDDTPKAIRQALQETRGFAGATGTITAFGPDREPDKEIVIARIAGHGFHYQASVRPSP